MTHQFAVWAAFSISAAISLGCSRNMTWLPGSSSVSDLALLAMNRSRSGLIWRSFEGITAKLGFFDQAATVTFAPKESGLPRTHLICRFAVLLRHFIHASFLRESLGVSDLLISGINDPSTHHRFHHLGVRDLIHRNLHHVAIEHNEVGQFARLE